MPSETPNYRQQVDQWFARNRQYHQSVTYAEKGLEHARLYQCTYDLHGTQVKGEWKRNKPEAKESAAKEAIQILNSWTYVWRRFPLS
jgi:dsRNA-specific ribonuclease